MHFAPNSKLAARALVCDERGVKKPRKVTFSMGARPAFKALPDDVATKLVVRLDDVASQPPFRPLPYVQVTEVAGMRVSFELSVKEVRVWSILPVG